jgi:hypothetical protein
MPWFNVDKWRGRNRIIDCSRSLQPVVRLTKGIADDYFEDYIVIIIRGEFWYFPLAEPSYLREVDGFDWWVALILPHGSLFIGMKSCTIVVLRDAPLETIPEGNWYTNRLVKRMIERDRMFVARHARVYHNLIMDLPIYPVSGTMTKYDEKSKRDVLYRHAEYEYDIPLCANVKQFSLAKLCIAVLERYTFSQNS